MEKLLICQILANVVVINVHHTKQWHLLVEAGQAYLVILEDFSCEAFFINCRKYIMHKHSASLFPYIVVLALCVYCQIGIIVIAYVYVFPIGGQTLITFG